MSALLALSAMSAFSRGGAGDVSIVGADGVLMLVKRTFNGDLGETTPIIRRLPFL
jgi:hypothetical protein